MSTHNKECLEEMEKAKPFITKQDTHIGSNKIGIVLMITNVTLCIALLGGALYWREIRLKKLEPKEQELCVPVSSLDLSLDFDPEEKGLQEFDGQNRENSFCGKSSVVLSFLVHKAIEAWDEGYLSADLPVTPEGCTTVVRETPSGHAHGIDFEEMKSEESDVVHWISSKLTLNGGIEHMNGRFLIMESGYYYISSQVKFSYGISTVPILDNIPIESSDDDDTFRHFVHKTNAGLESAEKMLEAAKSFCDSVVDESETTSIIGASFYLHEGDEVFVTTSASYKLLPSDESNHFSLYMI